METNQIDVNIPESVSNEPRMTRRSSRADAQLRHLSRPYDSSSSSETNVKVKVHRRPKKGNEYCLSMAIQASVKQLADMMPFSECELADEVVKNGCVTEDECKVIREQKDRKEQVRAIILLVKSRSYETMEKFLNSAQTYCPEIVGSIWKKYVKNMNENRKTKIPCPFCSMKNAVDIRRVVDDLWAARVICDTLVREITSSKDVVGRQDKYWNAILDECCKNKLKGLSTLCEALKLNGHYTHIVKGLDHHFHRQHHEHWFCTCSCSYPTLQIPSSKSRTPSVSSEATQIPESSPSEDELNVIDLDDEEEESGEEGKDTAVISVTSVPGEAMPSNGSISSRNTYDPPRQNNRERSRHDNTSWWRKIILFCGPSQFSTIEEETDS